MPNYNDQTVLSQCLISPDVYDGEDGLMTKHFLVTTTRDRCEFAVWLSIGGKTRRISHTPNGLVARLVYEMLRGMPYKMAMHHWIEAGYNDY